MNQQLLAINDIYKVLIKWEATRFGIGEKTFCTFPDIKECFYSSFPSYPQHQHTTQKLLHRVSIHRICMWICVLALYAGSPYLCVQYLCTEVLENKSQPMHGRQFHNVCPVLIAMYVKTWKSLCSLPISKKLWGRNCHYGDWLQSHRHLVIIATNSKAELYA